MTEIDFTTLSPDGTVNAAPFSMFNMVGEDPPVLMVSINKLQDGQLKDTAANILRTGEFVVHIADETMATAMHRCGDRLPMHETMETDSRYVFIGRIVWLGARDGLIDTARWRVHLQSYFPVGRFGASFYVNCRDRFAIDAADAPKPGAASTAIDEM